MERGTYLVSQAHRYPVERKENTGEVTPLHICAAPQTVPLRENDTLLGGWRYGTNILAGDVEL